MANERNDVTDERRKASVLLAWIAGFVDGVGYLVLLHMFTAHMSMRPDPYSLHTEA
jgi:uncharacterized membrane protein YoaK (UPF0700 family)